MKLIVGLGNPGSEYAKTRHNAGFMVLDRLAVRHVITGIKSKFHAGVLEGNVAGERCILMQPMTYMNRSGLSVGEAVTFYKLEVEEVLIVVDDVALPIGRIRVRKEGSAGGHNGLSDIERALGTNAYARLRIGIDAPGRVPQRDYVLQRFSEAQMEQLVPTIEKACDAIECWVKQGVDAAMNKFNAGEAPES
ncbi:MAG: aminoacyl-tRNA hydrolase [Phycisphaeraceae bacterium]